MVKSVILGFYEMNKKGQQEGVGLGTLLVLIVGVVAVIGVGYFIMNAFGFLESGVDALPSEYALALKSCELYASQGETALYCNSPHEVKIGGKVNVVNCGWLWEQSGKNITAPKDFNGCQTQGGRDLFATNRCTILNQTLEKNEYEKIILNGKKCDSWI
jgi:hypothetical protein